jgi:hypothetical protein
MARHPCRDPYRLLGISPDAPRGEITRAYVLLTAQGRAATGGAETSDLDTAFRLLWRPKTRARFDRLHQASVRRMRWTAGVGGASVLLLLLLGVGSGFWLATQDGRRAASPTAIPSAGPSPPPATAAAARSPALNPASVTLTAADLPSGYHVLSQGPASFGGGSGSAPAGSAAPPSWDVVFAGDSAQAPAKRLVESLAVVYPATSGARQGLAQVDAVEAAQTATREPPPAALGPDSRQWAERSPNGGAFTIIRLAWVTGRVVSQVSVLDVDGPGTREQAVSLALAQQRRLVD